jgi:hypothetical protein
VRRGDAILFNIEEDMLVVRMGVGKKQLEWVHGDLFFSITSKLDCTSLPLVKQMELVSVYPIFEACGTDFPVCPALQAD